MSSVATGNRAVPTTSEIRSGPGAVERTRTLLIEHVLYNNMTMYMQMHMYMGMDNTCIAGAQQQTS